MNEQNSTRSGFAAVLRNPCFALLWLGQLVSSVGDAVAAIAILVYVTEKNASAGAISTLALVELLPMVLAGPAVGVLIDRWDRKRILVASDLVRGVLFLGVVLHPNNTTVYIVALLSALAGLFFSPARSAMIPEIVAGSDLTAAIGLSQGTSQGVALVGPMLGGALTGFLGAGAVFVFNAATFFFSAGTTLLARVPDSARRCVPSTRPGGGSKLKAFFAEMGFGVTFLRRQPVLWFIVLTLSFFGAAGRFTFVGEMDYIRRVLVLDPARFGTLMTVSGAGAIAGALLAGGPGRNWPRGRAFYFGFLANVVTLVPYLLRPSYVGLLVLFSMAGLSGSLFQVPLTAIFYARTPVDIRGKVFSVTNSLLNCIGLVTLPLAGLVVGEIGAALTCGLVGLAGIAYGGIVLLLPGARELLSEGVRPKVAA